jgi:hypothetical protein
MALVHFSGPICQKKINRHHFPLGFFLSLSARAVTLPRLPAPQRGREDPPRRPDAAKAQLGAGCQSRGGSSILATGNGKVP